MREEETILCSFKGATRVNMQELIEEIKRKKQEIKTAGKIHRKDLAKYIHRLERDLKTYNQLMAERR